MRDQTSASASRGQDSGLGTNTKHLRKEDIAAKKARLVLTQTMTILLLCLHIDKPFIVLYFILHKQPHPVQKNVNNVEKQTQHRRWAKQPKAMKMSRANQKKNGAALARQNQNGAWHPKTNTWPTHGSSLSLVDQPRPSDSATTSTLSTSSSRSPLNYNRTSTPICTVCLGA